MNSLQQWIDQIWWEIRGLDPCFIFVALCVGSLLFRKVAGLSTGHPWATRLGLIAFLGAFSFSYFCLSLSFLGSAAAGAGALLVMWLLFPLVQLGYRFQAALENRRRWQREEERRRESYRPPSPSPAPVVDDREVQREKLEAQRRANARFEAETLYRRHFAAVRDAFPPEAFEKYLEKYLSDYEAPEVVEGRLEKFRDFLLDMAGGSENKALPQTREELARWYENERQRILQKEYAHPDDRNTDLARLSMRYAKQMDRLP